MELNELLELLPNYLYLARNSNAPDFDRWGLYSTVTKKTIEDSGSASAYGCMLRRKEYIEKIRKEWCNTSDEKITFELELLLFLDGNSWIVQCINWDLVAQGKDIESALKSFKKVLTGQIIINLEHNKEPFQDIPIAPQMFKDQFEESIKLEIEENRNISAWVIDFNSNFINVKINIRLKSK